MIPSAPLTRLLCTFLLGLTLAACGGEATGGADAAAGGDAPAAPSEDGGHDDSAPGPHGGAIAVVGDHVAHLEALHDENAGQVTVYILGEGNAVVALDQPPVLNLATADGSVQVKGESVGDAWLFENDALLDHAEKARFRLVIAGKGYQPDLPCSHGDDGGHEHSEDCDHETEHTDEHADHDEHDGHDDDKGHDDDHDEHEGHDHDEYDGH